MRCRLIDLVMMRCLPVDFPPEVLSLVDEVVERNARNLMGRVQEDGQQLP